MCSHLRGDFYKYAELCILPRHWKYGSYTNFDHWTKQKWQQEKIQNDDLRLMGQSNSRVEHIYFVVLGLCLDTNVKCAEWALEGYCETFPSYMKYGCKKSCNACEGMYYRVEVLNSVNTVVVSSSDVPVGIQAVTTNVSSYI